MEKVPVEKKINYGKDRKTRWKWYWGKGGEKV